MIQNLGIGKVLAIPALSASYEKLPNALARARNEKVACSSQVTSSTKTAVFCAKAAVFCCGGDRGKSTAILDPPYGFVIKTQDASVQRFICAFAYAGVGGMHKPG